MEWITTHREPGISDHDFFRTALDREIIACASKGNVFYAAVRTEGTDEVTALVIRMQRTRSATFRYQVMDETDGPAPDGATARLLDALTRTGDEAAIAWRARCRARLAVEAAAAALQADQVIELAKPVTFSSGRTARRFQLVSRKARHIQWLALCDNGERFACVLEPSWERLYTWHVVADPGKDAPQ
jgi:hypothetical protein